MVAGVVSVVAAVVLGLVVAYWAVIRGRLGSEAIRTRLLLGFVIVALLPAVAVAAGTAVVGYASARRQAMDRLESVAARKGSEIDAWVQSIRGELGTTLDAEYGIGQIGTVFELGNGVHFYEFYSGAVRSRLRRYADKSQLRDLSLLTLSGEVVLSSDISREGQVESDSPGVARALKGTEIELLVGPDRVLSVRAAVPVVDSDGDSLGILVGRPDVRAISDIIGERTGLEASGKAYLVGPQGALFVVTVTQGTGAVPGGSPLTMAHSAGIDAALQTQGNGVAFYDDYEGTPVIGVYRWLPDLQAVLLVEQNQSEAFQAITTMLVVTVGITLACILLAIGASLGITRSITRPLVRLAKAATLLADGNLAQVAPEAGRDEVGALARAFNAMTLQLRGLIGRLEERVAERTQALERRALQLETSARVSREVSSILSIDELLTRVAEMIRVAFHYYQVNVLLVDPEGKLLVRRASSGATNPSISSLTIGDMSLNALAAQSNRALLANDVASDSRYLADGNLPETQSELVVPLRVADRVLGTLDVHSSEADGFAAEDVLVIQSLADQIAIAIENARLYVHSRELATLEERNRLARELHDVVTQSLFSMTLMVETWREAASHEGREGEEHRLHKLGEIAGQTLREARLLVHELRPSVLEQEGLVSALQQRLNTVERRSGVEASLVVDGRFPVPRSLEAELYGIAIEALNNSIKHSGARSLTVRVGGAEDRIVLEVEDKGKGFDPMAAGHGGGLGLATMRERAGRIGGRLVIESGAGKGTTVRVSVPTE